jgi:ATP-dependent RNA helicase DDX24/MAK5
VIFIYPSFEYWPNCRIKDDNLAKEIKNLRFLVLDEADRMIEAGHFVEVENILQLTLRETMLVNVLLSDMLGLMMSFRSRDGQIPTDFDDIPGDQGDQGEDEEEGIKNGLQTFVFSATLSKDLQRNLKKRFRPKGNKKHYKRDPTPASTLGMRTVLQYHPLTTQFAGSSSINLDDLLLRLDFRDPTPEIIDLSPVGGIVSTLQEGKIECLSDDKVRLVNF